MSNNPLNLNVYFISLNLPEEKRDAIIFYSKAICEHDKMNWNAEFNLDLYDALASQRYSRGEVVTDIKGDGPSIPVGDSICYVEGVMKIDSGEGEPIPFGILYEIKNKRFKVRGIGPNTFVDFCANEPALLPGVCIFLARKPELLDKVWVYFRQKQTGGISENTTAQEQTKNSKTKKNWWEFWK